MTWAEAPYYGSDWYAGSADPPTLEAAQAAAEAGVWAQSAAGLVGR